MVSDKQRGGKGRNQGRKSNFPGLPREDASRISVPKNLSQPLTDIAKKLYGQYLDGKDDAADRLLSSLEPGLKSFVDVAIPASIGLTDVGSDNVEVQDLNELVKQHNSNHKNETYMIRATGTSMTRAGIYPNDWLIVEHVAGRISQIEDGTIVVAYYEASATVKRYYSHSDGVFLQPDSFDDQHKPLFISREKIENTSDFGVTGIVRFILHDPKNRARN